MLSDASLYNTDGIHPNQSGQNAISSRITTAIKNGDPNFSIADKSMSGTGLITLNAWCDGYNYHFRFSPSTLNFSPAVTIDSTWRQLMEYNVKMFTGYRNVAGYSWTFTMPCCLKDSNNGWTNGVFLACQLRQDTSDFTKVQLWVRQIGHFTSGAFTSFTAASIMPSAVDITVPVWGI